MLTVSYQLYTGVLDSGIAHPEAALGGEMRRESWFVQRLAAATRVFCMLLSGAV